MVWPQTTPESLLRQAVVNNIRINARFTAASNDNTQLQIL